MGSFPGLSLFVTRITSRPNHDSTSCSRRSPALATILARMETFETLDRLLVLPMSLALTISKVPLLHCAIGKG